MKIKWLGQAGYLLEVGGVVICIDPYLSDIVNEVEKMPRMTAPLLKPEELDCDLFLSTHDHLDHLDPVTVAQMKKEDVLFAGPPSCIERFRQLGVRQENLIQLGRGQEIRMNNVTLKGVFADHTRDSIGVAVRYQGRCVYFVGDSLYHEKLGGELDQVDVLFTCINGKLGNMNAGEAAALAGKLHPRLAIPNHYGMFAANTADPRCFAEEAGKLGIEVYIAAMGEEFLLESGCFEKETGD